MTKELLLATRDDFKAATGKDEQAQRVQRIYRILRREGLYNWRLTPVTRDGFVPKMAAVFGLSQIGPAETEKFKKFLEAQTGGRSDAAIDELYTALGRARATGAERKRVVDGWNALWADTWAGVALTYEMEASRGPQTISLAWDMERARFTIRVLEEGDATTQKMQTTVTGLVGFAFDREARNLIVSVRPAQMPITSGNPDIQSATAQPRLGPPVRKKDKASDKKEVKEEKKEAKEDKKEKTKGKKPPEARPDKQEQIDAKRKRIEEIKSDKAHVWKNDKTGEVVRQKRFKKLKEPFDYKGEGYAEPDADDKIKRLEREIATLESGVAPVSDKRASRLSSLTGPIISLAKRIYDHDEPVVIRYSVPPPQDPRGRVKVWVHFDFLAGYYFSKYFELDPKKRTLEVWIPLVPGEAFLDLAVRVIKYEENSGLGVGLGSKDQISTRQIRIVRREPPLPGAIRIAGGAIQPLGQPVLVDVHVPTDRFAGPNDLPNRHGKRKFHLRLVRHGNRLRGDAITTNRVIARMPVTEMVQRFDLTNLPKASRHQINSIPHNNLGIISPGEYEIQLVTDRFVVDRKRLTVTVDEIPNAIRLVSTEPLQAGKSFDVVFDAPKLARFFKYELHVLRVKDDGHVGGLGAGEVWEPGKPKPINQWRGGNSAVRLTLNYFRKGNYVLDELDFRVGDGGSAQDNFDISIDDQPAQGAVVQSGVKIPVALFPKGYISGPGETITVRLHATPADAPREAWKVPEQEWGPAIKEWTIKKSGYSNWNIERNLPVGRYRLALTWNRGPGPLPLANYVFRVTENPKDAQIDLGDERKLGYGQPIPISLKLPEGFSPDDPRLSLWIEFLGGRVPGCAMETFPINTGRPVAYRIDLKGRTSVTARPIEYPGVYIARLEYAVGVGHYERLPMAGTAFEVVIAPLSNALSLPGGPRYALIQGDRGTKLKEPVRVIVTLPADHPLRTAHGKSHVARLEVVRLGVTAAGGATTDPVIVRSFESNGRGLNFSNDGIAEIRFTTRQAGYYAARLYDVLGGANGCHQAPMDCLMLASVPFQVTPRPNLPFAPGDGGLGATDLRSDIPIAGGIWPPIGEHLTGPGCKPRIVEVEKMDLRFVRWNQGKYVPLDKPLDFGTAFYVEGKVKGGATRQSYSAQFTTPDGKGREITLYTVKDDPTLVRSEMLYLLW